MRIARGLTAVLLACGVTATPASAQTTYLLCKMENGHESYYSFTPNEFRVYSERDGWGDNICSSDRRSGNYARHGNCEISESTIRVEAAGRAGRHVTSTNRWLINRRSGYYEYDYHADYEDGQADVRVRSTGTCERAENPEGEAQF